MARQMIKHLHKLSNDFEFNFKILCFVYTVIHLRVVGGVCVCVCVCVCLSRHFQFFTVPAECWIFRYISLSFSLSLSFHLSFFAFTFSATLIHSLFPGLCLFFSPPHSSKHPPTLSLSLSPSVCLSLSLSVSPSPSLYLPLPPCLQSRPLWCHSHAHISSFNMGLCLQHTHLSESLLLSIDNKKNALAEM